MTGRWRTASVLVVALLTLAAVALIPRLRIDNRLERWLGDDDVEASEYAAFRRDFGSDDIEPDWDFGDPGLAALQVRVGHGQGGIVADKDLLGRIVPQDVVDEGFRHAGLPGAQQGTGDRGIALRPGRRTQNDRPEEAGHHQVADPIFKSPGDHG